MITHDIALRYAKVLFQLATNQEELKRQLDALEHLVSVLNHHPKIKHYFSSPHISVEQKGKVVAKSLGTHMDPLFVQYVMILLKKRWFNHLPEILKQYRQMVMEALGMIEGRLITAEPLDHSMKEKFKSKLEKIYQKKLKLKEETDSQLIGGGILIVSNRLIDFSIKNKLTKLKNDLLSTNRSPAELIGRN